MTYKKIDDKFGKKDQVGYDPKEYSKYDPLKSPKKDEYVPQPEEDKPWDHWDPRKPPGPGAMLL